jgi:hemerythrin
MALLSWSTQYAIGNELIDNEHQELFRRINDFHDHWIERREAQAIAVLLNQLIAYAEMHFQHEEAIMRDAGFPRLEEHQAVHEAMVVTIFRLRQIFEQNNGRIEMETIKFVKSWLIEHIVRNDYLFRDFLARRKIDVATDLPQ